MERTMRKKIDATKGSGNVFADIGVAAPEEALAKAKLARKISEIIKHRHLTQKDAAAILGIDQPKISALMHGRLGGFSTERLFKFLNALGRDVEIVIKRKPRSRQEARVAVVASL
jgi:predicted XRE-type DNA-binding protein